MRKTLVAPLALAATSLVGIAIAAVASRRDPAPAEPSLGPTRYAPAASAAPAEPAPPAIPPELALKQVVQLNANAFIPPQCYTKTKDEAGNVHNPCFVCHQHSREPNYIDDGDVQLEYAFVANARFNPWQNLFVDWRPLIANVGDDEIDEYVRRSNYFDEAGAITLAKQLAALPAAW